MKLLHHHQQRHRENTENFVKKEKKQDWGTHEIEHEICSKSLACTDYVKTNICIQAITFFWAYSSSSSLGDEILLIRKM